MQEIKNIVCDDKMGETLWEGVLLPSKNGNYEGFIHSSITMTYINFDYVGCDVRMVIRSKSLVNDKSITNKHYLALVNDSGLTEWFISSDNTVVCTRENITNALAKTYKRKIDEVKKATY